MLSTPKLTKPQQQKHFDRIINIPFSFSLFFFFFFSSNSFILVVESIYIKFVCLFNLSSLTDLKNNLPRLLTCYEIESEIDAIENQTLEIVTQPNIFPEPLRQKSEIAFVFFLITKLAKTIQTL